MIAGKNWAVPSKKPNKLQSAEMDAATELVRLAKVKKLGLTSPSWSQNHLRAQSSSCAGGGDLGKKVPDEPRVETTSYHAVVSQDGEAR